MALLLAVSSSFALVAQPPCAVAHTLPLLHARAAVAMKWQDEPIFDTSKVDPVFEEESGYKGRVSYGFSNAAEKINGRVAMMGFTITYLQELLAGKGVLEQYGLPYDEGAVLVNSGSGNPLFGLIGLVGGLIFTVVLSFAGEALYTKVFNPEYDGTKLPFNPLNKD